MTAPKWWELQNRDIPAVATTSPIWHTSGGRRTDLNPARGRPRRSVILAGPLQPLVGGHRSPSEKRRWSTPSIVPRHKRPSLSTPALKIAVRQPHAGSSGARFPKEKTICITLFRSSWRLSWLWGSLLSVVSTLCLLNESQEHLVLSRPHPMLTLVPGYVLKEFGTLQLDWSCWQ